MNYFGYYGEIPGNDDGTSLEEDDSSWPEDDEEDYPWEDEDFEEED
jgi:hypothetical protein